MTVVHSAIAYRLVVSMPSCCNPITSGLCHAPLFDHGSRIRYVPYLANLESLKFTWYLPSSYVKLPEFNQTVDTDASPASCLG
jgi:hypothetical protein